MSDFNMMDLMGFNFVFGGKKKPKLKTNVVKVKHRIIIEKDGQEKEITVWAESRNVAKMKIPPGSKFVRFVLPEQMEQN